jgi:hypothetical protein
MVEVRRLFAELLGAFFLVLAGAGSAVVGARTATDMRRAAQVTGSRLDGHGPYLVRGSRQRRSPQPGGDDRLHGARRLPLETRSSFESVQQVIERLVH